jgi:hypothetical protein
MGHKGHYGEYSGNARHSKHHMVNSWEEEDVKRGRKEMEEGHKGHAEALFDDAHGSYNWDGHNSTGAEHGLSRKSRSERLRKRAMNRSERTGAEWGDYDYEDPRVQKMLEKANELEARTGEGRKAMNKLTKKIEKMPDGPVWGTPQHEGFHREISQYSGNSPFNQLKPDYIDYEEQQKRHTEKTEEPVEPQTGERFPGVKGGQRNPETFIKSHPHYISKEQWENASDEQKGLSRNSCDC